MLEDFVAIIVAMAAAATIKIYSEDSSEALSSHSYYSIRSAAIEQCYYSTSTY